MIKKISLSQDKANETRPRLDQFLSEFAPKQLGRPLSKGLARKLILAGAVYINGKRVKIASKPVFPGSRVDAYIDLKKLQDPGIFKEQNFELTDSHILYEDDDIILLNKPPFLPTQPTLDKSRNNLFEALKRFLGQRTGNKEGYAGLHHRLDRDTSGVILFTKNKDSNLPVAKMFAEHTIEKTYIAITDKPRKQISAGESFRIQDFLKRDPRSNNKAAKYISTRSGGQSAHTDFRVLEIHHDYALIEAKPRTGRTHQIRVHLSEWGAPICGDSHYGSQTDSAPRVMLHASHLEFLHPRTQKKMRIEAPVPSDFQKFLDE